MSLDRQGSYVPAADAAARDAWRHTTIHAPAEVIPLVEAVTAAMADAGYPDRDRFGVRLALEEALVNAIKHGNGGDRAKAVRVRYLLTAEEVVIEVEDEGPGFDPAAVPDPRSPENLDRPSGRGVLLMRTYATWLRYNDRGNCVALGRRHSALARAAQA